MSHKHCGELGCRHSRRRHPTDATLSSDDDPRSLHSSAASHFRNGFQGGRCRDSIGRTCPKTPRSRRFWCENGPRLVQHGRKRSRARSMRPRIPEVDREPAKKERPQPINRTTAERNALRLSLTWHVARASCSSSQRSSASTTGLRLYPAIVGAPAEPVAGRGRGWGCELWADGEAVTLGRGRNSSCIRQAGRQAGREGRGEAWRQV